MSGRGIGEAGRGQGAGRGRGRGRFSGPQRVVSEESRINISEQLAAFRASDETSPYIHSLPAASAGVLICGCNGSLVQNWCLTLGSAMMTEPLCTPSARSMVSFLRAKGEHQAECPRGCHHKASDLPVRNVSAARGLLGLLQSKRREEVTATKERGPCMI